MELVRMGERQDKGGGYRVMKLMKNKRKRETITLSFTSPEKDLYMY